MPDPTSDEVSAAVDAWFASNCKRSPLARDTDAYNQVQEALPDLKTRLSALVAPPARALRPTPVPPTPPVAAEPSSTE